MSEPAENWEKFFDEKPGEGEKHWLRQLNEDHWLVKTKKGIFQLQELEWDKVDRAKKRNDKSPELSIISESIVGFNGKKFTAGELEIKTWKGSVVMRLLAAINSIYEVDDFLSESKKEE
jgi:hypothetical protein